jgi:hypothetical protein
MTAGQGADVIFNFVEQLRAHYHAVGLVDADKRANDYAAAIAGMYRLRGESAETTAHFENLLELHRADLPFLEKRARISEALKSRCKGKGVDGPQQLHIH